MNALAGMSQTALGLVVATLLISAGTQVVHGYARYLQSRAEDRVLVAVYEGALLVHIIVLAAFAADSFAGVGAIAPIPGGPALSTEAPLWLNLPVAVIAAYTAVRGLSDADDAEPVRDPGWTPAVEAVGALACTPPAIALLGPAWDTAFIIVTVFLLFREVFLLMIDTQRRKQVISTRSVTEAIKRLPEGLLYADERGKTLLANEVMRHCLAALDIPSTSPNANELWAKLNALADGPHGVPVAGNVERDPGAWVTLRISDDEVRLFAFEGLASDGSRRYPGAAPLETTASTENLSKNVFGRAPRSRIIAYDVTREIETLEEISRTNEALEASQQELRDSMDSVKEAAENEAMLRMRSRVHDVMGQRLSMLHRALEDDSLTEDRLERMKPLLNGILDDLSSGARIEPQDELAATVDAFALTGVTVDVKGDLPDDPARAKLFSDCIREAATNAVKHARSTLVSVSVSQNALDVSNNGEMPNQPVKEGSGLTGMRHAVDQLGGTMDIRWDAELFTLSIRMP